MFAMFVNYAIIKLYQQKGFNMKKLILAIALMLSFNTIATEANHIEMATKNATFINTNEGNGAGFMIKNTNLMITNKHVVSFKSKYINIINSDGKAFNGMYRWHSDKYDIALVEIFGKDDNLKTNNTDIRFKGGLDLCNTSTDLKIAEKIYGIGSPAGQRHVYREGYINSLPSFNEWAGYKVIQYQEYTGAGTSGSAIIRVNGDCVLGVNFAGLLNYDMGFAIPVEQLKEVLVEWEAVKHYSKEERVKYRFQEELRKLEKISDKLNGRLKVIKDRINGLDIKIALKANNK